MCRRLSETLSLYEIRHASTRGGWPLSTPGRRALLRGVPRLHCFARAVFAIEPGWARVGAVSNLISGVVELHPLERQTYIWRWRAPMPTRSAPERRLGLEIRPLAPKDLSKSGWVSILPANLPILTTRGRGRHSNATPAARTRAATHARSATGSMASKLYKRVASIRRRRQTSYRPPTALQRRGSSSRHEFL